MKKRLDMFRCFDGWMVVWLVSGKDKGKDGVTFCMKCNGMTLEKGVTLCVSNVTKMA